MVSKGKKWLSLKKTSKEQKRQNAKARIQEAIVKMQADQ
jgi:hypothetical protein